MNLAKARRVFPRKDASAIIPTWNIAEGHPTKFNEKGEPIVTEHLAQFSFNTIDVQSSDDDRLVQYPGNLGQIRCGWYLEFDIVDKDNNNHRLMMDFRDLWNIACETLGLDYRKQVIDDSEDDEDKPNACQSTIVSGNVVSDSVIEDEKQESISLSEEIPQKLVVPSRTRPKTKTRMAIVVDALGSLSETPEEQYQDIAEYFDDFFDAEVELVYTGHSVWEFDDLGRRVDFLIIDYGGLSLSIGYSGTTATDEVRLACEYADSHPNTLLIIWTHYTKLIYEYELKEEFGHLENIVFHFDDKNEDEVVKNWLNKG